MSRQHAIRFPDELHERIKAIAKERDRSFAYVVVKELEKALGSGTPDTHKKRMYGPRLALRPQRLLELLPSRPEAERGCRCR
jgi:predicted transcriptional regulator